MIGVLNLVTEANSIHQKFASRFESNEQNPVVLLARLKDVRNRFEVLKGRFEDVQAARDSITETLMSIHVPTSFSERIPEVNEQFWSVEKALDAPRKLMKAQTSANVGKEAVKRALKVDREARLASAVHATSMTRIQITREMFAELSQALQATTSENELQAGVDLLVNCGGRMPANSIEASVLEALLELEIVARKEDSQDVQISRKFGILFL
jgi:hypothetical protein